MPQLLLETVLRPGGLQGLGVEVSEIDCAFNHANSDQGAQLIVQLCSSLHERVALIVTTNLRFADWTQVFGNERLTGALLDRLTCKAHILELVGESYRFRQRLQRRSPDTLSTHPDVMGAGAGAADAGGPAASLGNISAERG